MKIDIRNFFIRNKLPLILSLIFFILGGVLISHHEIWRDEAQAWLLARDSHSLAELFYNLRFEGHPLLWYLVLWPVTRITSSLVGMQFVHLVISTLVVFVFTRYAPFSPAVKILFPFGYFSLFEYTVVARNYNLGILFLFIFCALYPRRWQNFWAISLVIMLMANTHSYFCVLALFIFLGLLGEALFKREKIPTSFSAGIPGGLLLILAGLISAIIRIKPDPDSLWASWLPLTLSSLSGTFSNISRGFFPVFWSRLDLWPNFLNSIISPSPAVLFIGFILSAFALIWIFILLLDTPVPFLIFFGPALVMIYIVTAKFGPYMRQMGMFFYYFLAAAWLLAYADRLHIPPGLSGVSPAVSRFISKRQNLFLTIVLICHLFGAVIAAGYDYAFPFSNSKTAAEFLLKRFPEKDFLLVGENYQYSYSPLMAYLKATGYVPSENHFISFTVYSQSSSLLNHDLDYFLKKSAALARGHRSKVVLMLPWQLIGRCAWSDYLSGTIKQNTMSFEKSSKNKLTGVSPALSGVAPGRQPANSRPPGDILIFAKDAVGPDILLEELGEFDEGNPTEENCYLYLLTPLGAKVFQ